MKMPIDPKNPPEGAQEDAEERPRKRAARRPTPSRLLAKILGAGISLPAAAAFLFTAAVAGVPATTAIGRAVLGGAVVFLATSWMAGWLFGSIGATDTAARRTKEQGTE